MTHLSTLGSGINISIITDERGVNAVFGGCFTHLMHSSYSQEISFNGENGELRHTPQEGSLTPFAPSLQFS